MNATSIIVIAVAVVVVLGMISFVTLARRSDVRGTGALSAETRQRDRAARAARPVEASRERGRGRGGRCGRTHRHDAGAPRTGAARAVGAARPRGDRRQPADVLQPRHRGADDSRHHHVRGGELRGVPLAVQDRWLRGQGGDRQHRRHQGGITAGSGFFYAPEARTWVTAYPADAIPKAEAIYSELILVGMRAGIVALYQKCPHLGCRVPQCVSSQWFECPCHGRSTTASARRRLAPHRTEWTASRSRWPATATSRSTPVSWSAARPIGTNTTGQEAEGPHCIGQSEH